MYVYMNVSHIPYKGTFEDVFPVEQRWDMLVSWKVAVDFFVYLENTPGVFSLSSGVP